MNDTVKKYRIRPNEELLDQFEFLSTSIGNLKGVVQNDIETTYLMIDAWLEQAKSCQQQLKDLVDRTFSYIQKEVSYATLQPEKSDLPDEPPSLT